MGYGKLFWGIAAFGGIYGALPSEEASSVQSFGTSAPEATQRLLSERRVVNGTGMGSLTVAAQGFDGQAMTIGVTRAGNAHGIPCQVAVSADADGGSDVAIDCTQPGAGNTPMRDVGAKAIAVIVREHVAATVESRTYDIDSVTNKVMALVAMNGPAIAASLKPPA